MTPGSPAETPGSADAALVQRCLEGDSEAFRGLVDRYQADVYSTALRIVGRPEDAEDVTQDTFLRAFRALKRYDTARPFGAWLFTIATRLCIDHHRRHRAKMVSLTRPEEGSAEEERTIDLVDPGERPDSGREEPQEEHARRERPDSPGEEDGRAFAPAPPAHRGTSRRVTIPSRTRSGEIPSISASGRRTMRWRRIG